MIRPNENPLIPASLAADGMQGADGKAQGLADAQHSAPRVCEPVRARARARWLRKLSSCTRDAQETDSLFLALVALDAARGQLDGYARLTDEPKCGAVEAADLIDAARTMLAQASAP